jgi:cytochrome c-type biogenesis protein CcmH/NrfG
LLAPAQTDADSRFAALAAQAARARESDRLDEAIGSYRKALALRPEWAEGWWYLGTLLYDRDAYADAAGALRNVVRLSPKHGVGYVMLGLSEAKLGRAQDALEHIEQGRKLGIGDDPRLRRVMLYTEGAL